MKKPYVFISYSTKEAETANLVHSYLEGNGINCWIASQNIEGGESFAVKIVDAIEECSAFVMIASPNSNESPHVSNELSLAFGSNKKIIPFRLQNYKLSKANMYFLNQAQWIDAYDDINGALKHLLKAVRSALPQDAPSQPIRTVTKPKVKEEKQDENTPDYTRNEIVNILLNKIEKFPYCLRDRTNGNLYESFKAKARILFDNTLSMYFKGRPTSNGIDFVDIIVDTLSQGNGIAIQVNGLPGCAKNMLIQLAYYKMLENFRSGESDYLPVYLSSSYYEKYPYTQGKAREEMSALIGDELKEYFIYLSKNPSIHPVLMVEAVREHIVSDFAPEDIIAALWKRFDKYNRIVAIDVGLIKNHIRLKKSISLIGDTSGYNFKFNSVPITNKDSCITVIRTILDMYIEQYDGVEAVDVYNALYKMRFSTIDIFTVRLVATELSQGHSADDISLVDMYERLAVNDLKGDEEKMLAISKELYTYVFNDRYSVKTKKYNAVLWSLPHKHNTYLEFMIPYYFSYCVQHTSEIDGFDFLKMSMTSMEKCFMTSMMKDNYLLQEAMLEMVIKNYDSFDVFQKSTAAYWLGKLTYAKLVEDAIPLLKSEYDRLKPLVKADNRQILSNRYNQYLFRSVCLGLISYGRTNVLDEYLCLLVINDVANAINRGTVIQYMGDSYHDNSHNDFYLDDDPNLGMEAMRILCSRVEANLKGKMVEYVEFDLVSLLTLVQARMHTIPEKLSYNLMPFCKKCLGLLEAYRKRPRSIISDKLIHYFESIYEDLEKYISTSRFDAAFTLYKDLSAMKDVKRVQWLGYGIADPESVADHTLNAWMMGTIFLPFEYKEEDYNKQEILEMLLVHDMAEAVLGDQAVELSEPTRELKDQNNILKNLFLKGTYPEVANMTHLYNVWTGYYNGRNINARIARDINLIQTVNTFFDYFVKEPDRFTYGIVSEWLSKKNKLSTNLGYILFDRIIVNNPLYRKAVDKLITKNK